MISQIIFSVITVGSFGFFIHTCYRITKLFLLTHPDKSRFSDLGHRMKTTLFVAFGQTKMMKRPLAGILHALVYWGFLVITIGSLEMMIDGVTGTERVLSVLGIFYNCVTASADIFAALIIVSCTIFLGRRYITKPKRFIAPEMKPSSRADATFILGMILVLMVSLLLMNAAYITRHPDGKGTFPVAGLLTPLLSGMDTDSLHAIEKFNWWTHILIIYGFLNFLPFSKHFHVISSVPNVFFTRLEPYAKLGNMESVTREVKLMLDPNAGAGAPPPPPERFGVKDAEDVTWKTLMDSYTCTECGRCSAVCPANTTGKLLSPRKLFIDLRRRMKDKGPGLLDTGKEFTDGKMLVGPDYITEEELWACTTCMACIEECPVDIDHVPFIIDMRRNLVMEESKVPAGLAMMFSNIENNGAPWQFSPSDRFNWAADISINEK